MPAKSEAQRRFLNAKFGHDWVKRHHFDNEGDLPGRVRSRDHAKHGHRPTTPSGRGKGAR